MQIPQLYELYLENPSVQTDTRKLLPGDLFFALSGPYFNGNHFALPALEAGASYAVVNEPPAVTDERIIVVQDVLKTLQELAKHHRQQFTIPFIAITGSNGKTTTKELVSAVLSTTYATYTTQGNLNNHIGIPLTLLRVAHDAQMAVIEMGANHLHEIEEYCKYVLPTHGIITNCGKAHLEGFGSLEGVRRGKGELFDFLRVHNGTAFIFNDYEYLRTMSAGINRVVTYGTERAEMTGIAFSNDPFLTVATPFGNLPNIHTRLVGEYNLPNVLCALAVGNFFKVSAGAIKTAIENYAPANSRSQLIEMGTNTIILDAYNANPTSVKAAIENFAHLQADRKLLMLGAMMELGTESEAEHLAIIHLLNKLLPGQVVLVGGDFGKIVHPYTYFENSTLARGWFKQQALKIRGCL